MEIGLCRRRLQRQTLLLDMLTCHGSARPSNPCSR
jgi:hypothetical protein